MSFVQNDAFIHMRCLRANQLVFEICILAIQWMRLRRFTAPGILKRHNIQVLRTCYFPYHGRSTRSPVFCYSPKSVFFFYGSKMSHKDYGIKCWLICYIYFRILRQVKNLQLFFHHMWVREYRVFYFENTSEVNNLPFSSHVNTFIYLYIYMQRRSLTPKNVSLSL